jgi:hypothetical protein
LTHSVLAQNRGPSLPAVELANIGPVEPVSPLTHVPRTPQPLTPLSEAIADALKAQPKLLATDPTSATSDLDYAAAVAFYTARGFEPIWISQASPTAGRLTPRARAAIDELQRAADWGLDPADFPAMEVRKIANDGPEDNKVKLTAKIPVHITYFTAIADQALNVATAPDLYGHEKRITLALQGQFDKIKKLDPPVIVPGKPAPRREIARAPRQPRYADGIVGVGGQGVRVNGRYPPPAALGYYRAQQQWGFFSQPPPSPERSSGRSRGTSPNDTFMRSLMNGP